MLKVLGLDEEDSKTVKTYFDGLWLCKNCPETMKAMDWEDLVSHFFIEYIKWLIN
jgi:hypothetical protein